MPSLTEEHLRAPALWEADYVQRRVLEITCQNWGFEKSRVSLDWAFGTELVLASLDPVEYLMALEAEFHITIDDRTSREWFSQMPFTLRRVSEMVLALAGTGRHERAGWTAPRPPLPDAEIVPCTQQGGSASVREWLDGPLYEPLGANREGWPQYLRRTDGMRCVLLPAAAVRIGSADPDEPTEERPAHVVQLSGFLMDAEPVSTRAYARFLNSVAPVPSTVLQEWCLLDRRDHRREHFPMKQSWRTWAPRTGTEQQPIVLVSWYGANAYSLWAGRRDWRRYRADAGIPDELHDREPLPDSSPGQPAMESLLPSEAQWEYAAHGRDVSRYPWGNEAPTPERLRVARHVLGATYTAETLPAAMVSARLGMSPFGLHHMAGNVWQWCRDWYASDFYRRAESRRPDAENSDATSARSERGGSWVGPEDLARTTSRRGRPPHLSGRCLGFRCVGLVQDLPGSVP
jgi:acyl carrier protein